MVIKTTMYLPEWTRAVIRVDAVDAGAAVHAAGLRAVLVVGLAVDAREAERARAGVRRHVLDGDG